MAKKKSTTEESQKYESSIDTDSEENSNSESSSASNAGSEDAEEVGSEEEIDLAGYESEVSIYDLLSDDDTDDEEEILGPSFNIRYGKKYIPGNKIHKQLAFGQDTYREAFYKTDKGTPNENSIELLRKEIDTYTTRVAFKKKLALDQGFAKYYKEIKKLVLNGQKKMLKKKEAAKENESYDPDEKADWLADVIGKWNILKIKLDEDGKSVYPNFGTAKLTYFKNGQLYSKCIKVPRGKLDGHSERQIFDHVLDLLSDMGDIDENTPVILDINTLLSMCGGCVEYAKGFIKSAKKMLGKGNIKVRVSYHFPYSEDPSKNPAKGVIQQQIELSPNDVTPSKSFGIETVVISSGYREPTDPEKNTTKQAESVKKVDAMMLRQAFINSLGVHEIEDDDDIVIPAGYQDVHIDPNIARDGLCFYRAVMQEYETEYDTPEELQGAAIGYILDNLDEFQDFIMGLNIPGINSETHPSPLQAMQAYINYHLQNENDEGTWADHIMMQAVARVLDIDITVEMFDRDGNHNPEGAININAEEGGERQTITVGNIANLHFVVPEAPDVGVVQAEDDPDVDGLAELLSQNAIKDLEGDLLGASSELS